MIRLLQFSNGVARGGVEEHILLLLRGLDRRLFKLHLACTRKLAELIGGDVPEDVEFLPIDFEEPYHVRDAVRFRNLLRQYEIQIVHSQGFYSSLCASPVAWASGVLVRIETSHGREAWRTSPLKRSFVCDRMVGRFVSRYIAVSEANRDYLIREKRLPAEKITVIYPGSNLSRFSPAHVPPHDLKSSLGIAPSDPVVTFVGRLEPQKGHSILLDAILVVRNELPNVRLICAGDGRLRNQLEQRVRDLGLEHTVFFIGYPPDVRDWLAIADITVLPSLHEGLPVTPIESLASGRAVVATAVDGTPEVVLDGKTGLTVPPNDPNSLAMAICRLLKDRALATRLAEQGRQRVMDLFSVQAMVERTQQLYLDAAVDKLVVAPRACSKSATGIAAR